MTATLEAMLEEIRQGRSTAEVAAEYTLAQRQAACLAGIKAACRVVERHGRAATDRGDLHAARLLHHLHDEIMELTEGA